MSPPPQLNLIDELVFSVVRIECETPQGVRCGTGFFFAFLLEDGKRSPCLVTSRHVVEGATHGRFYLALKDEEGRILRNQDLEFKVPHFEERCHPHPDPSVDLVVFFVGAILQTMKNQGHKFHITYLSRSSLMEEDEIASLSILENIVLAGYPIGLWDRRHSQPVLRRGITATHPALPYNGAPEFLIDAPCAAGLGGAPIFVRRGQPVEEPAATSSLGLLGPVPTHSRRMALLGILCAGQHWAVDGMPIRENIATSPHADHAALARQNQVQLGYALNTSKLLDFELIVRAMVRGSR
ncbi:trypsin-like peptidase domain-containing protein [Pseudorhodoferax sp. Leaf267]|uniref:trypsin-like peptidase domain-containing protein n=1 Tax=Pseudorhodoferax sp. Leaf267 TaxID=1736316 RepID=UPI0006FEF852|nr:trypsin-like peptidase domain-containing protein [Pseudorhodoferax sp. Leaf267]KQP22758.1 hypothetical protein ASF43_02330 [Pseudorhodoferax sp. Leaf267]